MHADQSRSISLQSTTALAPCDGLSASICVIRGLRWDGIRYLEPNFLTHISYKFIVEALTFWIQVLNF